MPIDRRAGVNRVVERVYIGGVRAYFAAGSLQEAGITHILKLYEGPHHAPWPKSFTVCDNPVKDGELLDIHRLRRGVCFIQEAVAAGGSVLVLCGAGVSRSSTFVLAYLLESGYELPAAWEILRTAHPRASPALELWQSLVQHYSLPYSSEQVRTWWREGYRSSLAPGTTQRR